MHVITSIVVATDFSAAAKRAVLRAALIAKQYGAELHLLHVTGPLALYPGQEISITDSAAIYAATHDQHKTTARRLHDHYGIQVKVAQCIGRAHTHIADYATTVGADLVVIGARVVRVPCCVCCWGRQLGSCYVSARGRCSSFAAN